MNSISEHGLNLSWTILRENQIRSISQEGQEQMEIGPSSRGGDNGR